MIATSPWPVLALSLLASYAGAQDAAPLKESARIPLPGVEGRLDHFAVDLPRKRLFVAALGNNTVEVIDLQAARRIAQIKDLHEPQGLAYSPGSDRLLVTNGSDASVGIYDGASLELRSRVTVSQDPDNLRLDPKTGRVYVGHGSGPTGAIGEIDPDTGRLLRNIQVAGHPESFRLEEPGSRIFVNVPSIRKVVVIDRLARTPPAQWTIPHAAENFPMALDSQHHRLFIASRKPARVVVLDTDSGKPVASVPCVGDADDLFYDQRESRLYVTGGEGAITIVRQLDPDRYEPAGQIPTAPGARTGLFVPEFGALYLAAPHRASQPAQIRVYTRTREQKR